MKQYPSDKYNVAWFKLAECVARGEKERALGVYRLLSHSLSDKAYALQLEGDLLLAFNDDMAIVRYRNAFTLYQQQQRMREAAAVGEHLITLQASDTELLQLLIGLYKRLGNVHRMAHIFVMLLHGVVHKNSPHDAEQLLNQYDFVLNTDDGLASMKQYVLTSINTISEPLALLLLERLIITLLGDRDTSKLTRLLTELELYAPHYYQKAVDVLNNK